MGYVFGRNRLMVLNSLSYGCLLCMDVGFKPVPLVCGNVESETVSDFMCVRGYVHWCMCVFSKVHASILAECVCVSACPFFVCVCANICVCVSGNS